MAQQIQVGPCIPVETQLEKAEVGPASGPTRRLSHFHSSDQLNSTGKVRSSARSLHIYAYKKWYAWWMQWAGQSHLSTSLTMCFDSLCVRADHASSSWRMYIELVCLGICFNAKRCRRWSSTRKTSLKPPLPRLAKVVYPRCAAEVHEDSLSAGTSVAVSSSATGTKFRVVSIATDTTGICKLGDCAI